jgi:hypothetical protein
LIRGNLLLVEVQLYIVEQIQSYVNMLSCWYVISLFIYLLLGTSLSFLALCPSFIFVALMTYHFPDSALVRAKVTEFLYKKKESLQVWSLFLNQDLLQQSRLR